MVITKIFLFAVAIALLLVIAQRQQWVQRAGITGRCYAVNTSSTDSDGALYGCEKGRLTGFRDLGSNGCTTVRITAHQALWRCQAPLESLRGS